MNIKGISLIVVIFLINFFCNAGDTFSQMASETQIEKYNNPAKYFSEVDGHSQIQFQSLLNVIKNYYSEMSLGDIGFHIFAIWSKTKETIPDLSLYDFVAGFKDFIRDTGGSNDFSTAVVLYASSKAMGY